MEETQQAQAEQPQLPPILDQIKEYAETRFKLAKYKTIEKSTSVAASLVTVVVVAFSGIMTFMFLTFTIALLLGDALGAAWKGFGIVTLFYLLIAIIAIAAKSTIEKPIVNLLISKIFK
jgi:ABC-type sugar transport system permease subunit